jgi:hypothetical protein
MRLLIFLFGSLLHARRSILFVWIAAQEIAVGSLVSWMIQASIGPARSIARKTITRTLPNTRSSDQPPSPTKCNSDWCCAAVRAGAVTAAIGSTLLRSHGSTVVAPRLLLSPLPQRPNTNSMV